MLALLGGVIAFVFFLKDPPRPHFVAFVIDQYSDERIPSVPWAENDRSALESLKWQGVNTFGSQQKNLLLPELQKLNTRGNPREPLVVYLRAHAAGMDDGNVAFLPADARLDDPSTWIPLREVLQALKECKDQYPKRKRLLLLDLAMPMVIPEAGFLLNDVPDLLLAQLEINRQSDDTLHVLCSCDGGQVSLASEEMGHTIFVYFLLQGLAGKADRMPDGNKPNDQVTLQETIAYSRKQTDLWAWQNMRRRQTPVHVGPPDDDFVLTFAAGIAIKDKPLPPDYPPFLADGWKERDRWADQLGRETPSHLLRHLDVALLRTESFWRAGFAQDGIEKKLDARRNELDRKRLDQLDADETFGPRSIIKEKVRDKQPLDEDLGQKVRDLKEMARLHHLTRQKDPNPMDMANLKAKKADFLKPFAEKKEEERAKELTWIVFRVASTHDDLTLGTFKFWLTLLHEEGRPFPPFEEARFMKKLAEWQGKEEEWPAAAVPKALQLFREAQLAETAPRRWENWVAKTRGELSAARRQAEEQLLRATTTTVGEVISLLQDTTRKYGILNGRIRTLAEGYRTLEEALVFLPAYPAYMEFDASAVDEWVSAVGVAQALQVLLNTPPETPVPDSVFRDIEGRRVSLRRAIDSLGRLTASSAIKNLIQNRPGAGAPDSMEMRNLLHLPVQTVADRQKVWDAWRQLAGTIHQTTLAQMHGGSVSGKDTPPTFDSAAAMAEEYRRGLRRARTSLALLKLNGIKDARPIEDALLKVSRNPDEQAGWRALNGQLAQAWRELNP